MVHVAQEFETMKVVTEPLSLTLAGFPVIYTSGQAWPAGSAAMDRMWKELRRHGVPHQGKNIWVYQGSGRLFVSVELAPNANASVTDLDRLDLTLTRYAQTTHRGPYATLGATYDSLNAELGARRLKPTGLSLEIYGHDNGPDSVPEVDLLIEVEETR